jgi:hypothetical protein
MARQIINYAFTERLGRNEFVILPVITPEGNIKHLKIRPDVQPEQWLMIEWHKDSAGRLRAIKSAELTSERIKAGAVFLRDAYEAERNLDGWSLYEQYLQDLYTREGIDRDGKPIRVKMNRPLDHLHFPEDLLPKAVAERVAARVVKKSDKVWRPAGKAADDSKAVEPKLPAKVK